MYASFKAFCADSEEKSYFQTIKAMSESNENDLQNRKRLDILKAIGELQGDIIYCQKDVSHYFDKLMQDEYCLKLYYSCPSCAKKKAEKIHSLQIKNLNFALDLFDFYLKESGNKLCLEFPEQISMVIKYKLGPMITFSVKNNKIVKLNQIPCDMAHYNTTYALAGIISSAVGKTSNVHCIAYSYNIRHRN